MGTASTRTMCREVITCSCCVRDLMLGQDWTFRCWTLALWCCHIPAVSFLWSKATQGGAQSLGESGLQRGSPFLHAEGSCFLQVWLIFIHKTPLFGTKPEINKCAQKPSGLKKNKKKQKNIRLFQLNMWLMPGCPLPSPTPWITPRTLGGSSLAPVTHLIPPTPYLQADYGQGHPELCLL